MKVITTEIGKKTNILFGQLRRICKNCTQDHIFEDQADIIKNGLVEKGYPKQLIAQASGRAKKSSQEEYLGIRTRNGKQPNTLSKNTISSPPIILLTR